VGYELDCDSCGFEATIEDSASAYESARVHELDHPSHNVWIRDATPE
jgi:hypothetical protein